MLRRSGNKRNYSQLLDSTMERTTDTKIATKPNQNTKKPKTENSRRESFSSYSETEPDQEVGVEQMDISSNKTHSSLESFKSSTNIELESDISDMQNNENERDKDNKYTCPICELSLNSSHDITLHIRSHNNQNDEELSNTDPSKAYTCKLCSKILSSASSLDRHVLVHSGERPFVCTVCNMTFTTNGNMNRHKRTHNLNSPKTNSYESDESTDSNNSVSITTRSKRYENNNNKVNKMNSSNKRKSTDEDNNPTKKKCKTINNNIINDSSPQILCCPVCSREDFASLNVLEMHIEEFHPDHEVKCQLCDLQFKNYRVLNLHRYMTHVDNTPKNNTGNAVVGFKDLTFVDFSSDKFKYIARAQCEQNIHKSSAESPGFECDKCSRAFPCTSALEIHYKDCSLLNTSPELPSSLDSSLRNRKESETSEEDMKRDDFFANLNLQNKSSSNSPISEPVEEKSQTLRAYLNQSQDNSKDLADIQSIISVASAEGLLKQLSSKAQELPIQNSKDAGEDEAQDSFSAEFRKMKLRGEFPCRLCNAVFPNLRALKGHNRYHLTGNNTGPYSCNMCPHSSNDKAALIRHMRTHNGDRPYECSLCNYAFTTKANCERHLRNRHSKVTREEVKQSIIYHVNEDPNNDEMLKIREEPKKSFAFSSPEMDHDDMERVPNDRSTPLSSKPRDIPLIPREHSLNLTIPNDLSIVIPTMESLDKKITPKIETPVKIQVKSIDKLIHIPEYRESDSDPESLNDNIPSFVQRYHSAAEKQQPIDLSMEVLDLSKKSSSTQSTPTSITEPQDFTRRTLDYKTHATAAAMLEKAHQLVMAQHHQYLLNNGYPNIEPNNYYANQLKQMYMNGTTFPVPTPPFPMNPFFAIPPHPFLTPPQNPQELKDIQERIMRGLQLSGGGVVMNNMASLASDRLQAFHQQKLGLPTDIKTEKNFTLTPEQESKPPLTINTEQGYSVPSTEPKRSPKRSKETKQDPNSMKLVIKNGMLIPKQKQRRYRTERPFSCEKCQAKFTLRSNMERHVKQQHQEYWADRHRDGPARRGPHVSQTLSHSTAAVATKQQDFLDITKNYSIPEQVKCAILAQQLKSHIKEAPEPDMDDDGALIIDEDAVDENRPTKETEFKYQNHLPVNPAAKKIADEILMQAAAKQEFREKDVKDFDLKIATNLIPKSPLNLTRHQSFEPLNYQTKSHVHDLKLAQALAGKHSDIVYQAPKMEEADLVPVSRLLDNAVSQLPFGQYFQGESAAVIDESDGDEEGLVASGSNSEGNNSGSEENRSESELSGKDGKKKSAYSMAPNRVTCPFCAREFPWHSSLRRHVLTHTGQKPYKCRICPLLFTTKSNCDRHLNRKHGKFNQNDLDRMEITDNVTYNNNILKSSQSFLMRNVPERPFKCSMCPSSTFATQATLNNHINAKHSSGGSVGSNEHLSGSSRPETPETKEESRNPDTKETSSDKTTVMTDWEMQIGSKYNANDLTVPSNVQNSELPFKCHLCDGSYSERQDCLNHIRESHRCEYDLLMTKGALEAEPDNQTLQHHEENDETADGARGKFPDYTNRKVMCAFCMRRFWSAEDLRRHMRTHTGERPFECDVCRRRFTLKHSMLRHRKKHTESHEFVANEFQNVNNDNDDGSISGDEDLTNRNYSSRVCNGASDNSESDNVTGDLIGNLLGISDKGILNKVLLSSADEAAKLLGVAHGN